MAVHSSNSFYNLRLSLQQHLKLGAQHEDYEDVFPDGPPLIIYGRKHPTSKELSKYKEWLRFRIFDDGNWIPETPIIFQIELYTRETNDPYENRLDLLMDTVKGIFDADGGNLSIKEYRSNPANPTVAYHSDGETPVVMAVRYDGKADPKAPEEFGENLNLRILTFNGFLWKESESAT